MQEAEMMSRESAVVWVEFLEGRGSLYDRHLAELIRADAPIALAEVIYCEVLQGIRDDAVYVKVRASLQALPVLFLDGLRSVDHAAALYRICRRNGYTIRSTMDCLIAAVCLDVGAELFHHDRDVDVLAGVAHLKVYRPSAAS
jgi:predicted nucleic acid-binding protein